MVTHLKYSMSAIYLPFGKFVAVATPHALQQALIRTSKPLVLFLGENNVHLADIYNEMLPETCHWLPVGSFLLYMKRKYNPRRKRNELELISLTPSKFKKTKNKDFAEAIEVQTQAQTSFPAWFDD